MRTFVKRDAQPWTHDSSRLECTFVPSACADPLIKRVPRNSADFTWARRKSAPNAHLGEVVRKVPINS